MIQPYARRDARLHFYTGTRARSLAFIRTARLMSSLGRRPEDNRDSRLETACFAHRYEDGDRDTGLKAKYVKPVDSGSDRSRSRSRSRSPKRGRKLREGARVEARYRLGAARKITEFVSSPYFTQAAARSSTPERLAGTDEMGRSSRCRNQVSGAPRHRRDVA